MPIEIRGRGGVRSSGRKIAWTLAVAAAAAIASIPAPAVEEDFEGRLARVDRALRDNPNNVSVPALNSCLRQRNFAAKLYDSNHFARAERSLKFCFQALKISATPPVVAEVDLSRGIEKIQAKAARELEQALTRQPNLENGLEIYRGCAECHSAEGWGMKSGLVPQLAGQHRSVVIKQLADIRAGNRETVLMAPYATVEVIGGVQAVADVAGYIDTLEISTANGKGPGDQLELGEKLYQENCVSCHGAAGEGDAEATVPRIQAQHYNYLVRQFEWIRDGNRRNANAEMQTQIENFDQKQVSAVLDYVSRLEPPEELQAPEGWSNPDFAE